MNGSMIGRVFNNRYQLTELIGSGGMAEVYRAEDRVLGRMVAVKVMLPQFAEDPEFTQRFRHEAAAAANLQSPYIVNVYDWGLDDGTYYIVMEYVNGSDLKSAIQKRGAINKRKVAEIGAQVCQALSVAHNLDIIHRDIKAQNIMVQVDGNVKVMDFGIAQAKNSTKAQTQAVLGTAHYISPEQAQGKTLTAASDLYSLGVVLYEAATGKLPFDGPDAVSVAMQQVTDAPVPPSQVNPDVDPVLESIIMRALEKDPYARFATASEMKSALNDYLMGRTPVLNPAAAYAIPSDTTTVMPPMEGTAGSHVSGSAAPKNTFAPEKSKKSKKVPAIIAGIIAVLLVVAVGAWAALGGFSSPNEVPNLTGKTPDEAAKILKDAGLSVGETTESYSDSVDAGKIIDTDPKAGTRVDKDTAINLNISKGKEQIEVPDLSGLTEEQAKTALTKAGFKPKAGKADHFENVEKGYIGSQDPKAGTKADKGSTVTYVVSEGPDTVSVPDVLGKNKADATATLQNAGFTVETAEDYSDSVAEGKVMAQSPDGSTQLAKGGTVSITISLGEKPKQDFQIDASASTGGSITPGSTTVQEGQSQYYTVTANSGYVIASVIVDGQPRNDVADGATSYTYQFEKVSGNHSISATFQKQNTNTGNVKPDTANTNNGRGQ